MINDLADLQDDLNKLEYQYKKMVATYKRDAMKLGAKTREIECVEYLGNSEEEERKLSTLMGSIFDRRRAVRILWGKVEAWKAQKDIWRSDSFHQITGRGAPSENFFGSEDEN